MIKGNIPPFRQSLIKPYTGEIDLLLPADKEEEYMAKHNIEIRYLPTGAALFGALRKVEDVMATDLDFGFLTGAYFDPVGKKGIHHLLEHVIAAKGTLVAKKYQAYHNAYTSTRDVSVVLRGTSNPKVRNYGIWPVIPVIMQDLTEQIKLTDDELSHFKEVVVGEINEKAVEHARLCMYASDRIIFGKTNPLQTDPLGTKEEVMGVTVEDLNKVASDVFSGEGLELRIYSEGDKKLFDSVVEEIAEKSMSIKPSGRPVKHAQDSLFDSINEKYSQGQTYSVDTKFRNGLVNIFYAFVIPSVPYMYQTYAMSRVFELAEQRFFKLTRDFGLSYSADAYDIWPGDTMRVFQFALTVAKRPDIEKYARDLYPKIKTAIFDDTTKEDINFMSEIKLKELEAVPTTVYERLADAINGVKKFGKLIDTEKAKEAKKNVTVEMVKEQLTHLQAIDPAVIIAGDLY